ncbi:MAG: hypothetical protein KF753_10205 [Caldilineaceae bacterium]|nr:hypothetical protein [Caldilineaceae bacterium]
MLVAHLVPGYFAGAKTAARQKAAWSPSQRLGIWAVALGSTVAPDSDVLYNALFRGFFNHTWLWTHSLFPYLGMGMGWLLLRLSGRWPRLQTLVGLASLGGLSHLALDVIAHSTPIFYPLSSVMVGAPSARVLAGGVVGYLTDPIFLCEPLLIALAAAHWVATRDFRPQTQRMWLLGIGGGTFLLVALFLLLLPFVQQIFVV